MGGNILKENGMGKEYYSNGKLKYVGEFLDGKYNGKGKEYFQNRKVKNNGIFSKDKLIENIRSINNKKKIF